jgi:hypothetical protein
MANPARFVIDVPTATLCRNSRGSSAPDGISDQLDDLESVKATDALQRPAIILSRVGTATLFNQMSGLTPSRWSGFVFCFAVRNPVDDVQPDFYSLTVDRDAKGISSDQSRGNELASQERHGVS